MTHKVIKIISTQFQKLVIVWMKLWFIYSLNSFAIV